MLQKLRVVIKNGDRMNITNPKKIKFWKNVKGALIKTKSYVRCNICGKEVLDLGMHNKYTKRH